MSVRRSTLVFFSVLFIMGIVLKVESSSIKVEKLTSAVELGEGPHWSVEGQNLYYVDINGQRIMRYNPASQKVTSAYLKCGHVGMAVPVEGTKDKFVVGCGRDLVLVTWDSEKDATDPKIQKLTTLDTNRNGTRINDGKCDPAGRLFVGTMAKKIKGRVEPKQGSLYSVDENLTLKTLYSPVTISNGLTWNLSNDTLYYIDSDTYQIWAFDYSVNDGSIRNKRVVFDLKSNNVRGLPDGMTLDADGNLWIALMFGGAVIQVDPRQGKLLRSIGLPADRVSSVAFGGPNLDVLYVTSAHDEMTREQINLKPTSGCLFSVTGLKVRGRPPVGFKLNRNKIK